MKLTAKNILCFDCARSLDIFERNSPYQPGTSELIVLCREPNGEDRKTHLKSRCPFFAWGGQEPYYENIRCPVCGEHVIFVGVCDDEGNYRGPVGCEYESDPYSGLNYTLHHMTSDCLLNTDGEDSALGHRSFDSVANAVMSLEVFYTHG